jgi:hypothetical protein
MVVLLVNIIVEELARPAEVLPHADSAVAAHRRNRLLGVANKADDLQGEEEKSTQEETG